MMDRIPLVLTDEAARAVTTAFPFSAIDPHGDRMLYIDNEGTLQYGLVCHRSSGGQYTVDTTSRYIADMQRFVINGLPLDLRGIIFHDDGLCPYVIRVHHFLVSTLLWASDHTSSDAIALAHVDLDSLLARLRPLAKDV